MSDEYLSAVETRTSPGGVPFDQYRGVSEQRVLSWGMALDRIKSLIGQHEPQLTGWLNHPVSAEYKSVAIIDNATDSYLKAELVRIYIRTQVAIGGYFSAVSILGRSTVCEAQIPELQNPEFVHQVYQKALTEEDYWQAWKIADMVADDRYRDKLFKPRISGDLKPNAEKRSPYYSGWDKRASYSRNLHIDQTYNQYMLALEGSDFSTRDTDRLERVWLGLLYSEDGYRIVENRHPLANPIALALCQGLAKVGDKWLALSVLEDSHLPEDLERQLTPLLPLNYQQRREIKRRTEFLGKLLRRK